MTKNLRSSLVSSVRRPALVMIHSVCLPSIVSPICLQSHSSASHLKLVILTLNALPSPQFARNPMNTGLIPAFEKSGNNRLSPCTWTNTGSASARHLHPRTNVASDTSSAKKAMVRLTTDAFFCSMSKSSPIYPSFPCCVGLLFVVLSLALQGKGPIVSHAYKEVA